jgi:hypothetical protein
MTKRVLMRLDKFLAEILASIDPTATQRPDGTFVVVLNKACTDASSRPSCGTRCCAGARAIGFAATMRLHPREGKATPSGATSTTSCSWGTAEEARRRRGQLTTSPASLYTGGAPSTT